MMRVIKTKITFDSCVHLFMELSFTSSLCKFRRLRCVLVSLPCYAIYAEHSSDFQLKRLVEIMQLFKLWVIFMISGTLTEYSAFN